MYTVVDTPKTFEQACGDLEAAVKRHGFGVLHVHDLGATLRSKGVPFAEECRVFEVCNPGQAGRVMAADLRLNMALPCRISVYTEGGSTRMGTIRPEGLIGLLSDAPGLAAIAAEVGASMDRMLEDAK